MFGLETRGGSVDDCGAAVTETAGGGSIVSVGKTLEVKAMAAAWAIPRRASTTFVEGSSD
jgi:hypothetical protein